MNSLLPAPHKLRKRWKAVLAHEIDYQPQTSELFIAMIILVTALASLIVLLGWTLGQPVTPGQVTPTHKFSVHDRDEAIPSLASVTVTDAVKIPLYPDAQN